jgi:hypothetical protein
MKAGTRFWTAILSLIALGVIGGIVWSFRRKTAWMTDGEAGQAS